ncbi:MAG: hypothetical protein EOP52_08275 [Sphingobacteriales bacterium]|nr:MAG: hypothetical protein EOP52_08275 [Sphingobacteriales bacterium]
MKNTFRLPVRVLALAVATVLGTVSRTDARAPEKTLDDQGKKLLLKTAAGCTAPEAKIDLDINNVRAQIMTAGNMWYDPGTSEARYEIPKGSRKNSLYAGALWIGGRDTQGNLKVTAQLYRADGKNDYWTGPLDPNNNIDAATCNLWDRFWKVNGSDIARFRELARQYATDPQGLENALAGAEFLAIKEWPAKGSLTAKGTNDQLISYLATTTRDYAPFVDVDGDQKYDYLKGDYPNINGDQYIWRIYNDMGGTKTQSGSLGIGLEIQASAFAYSTKDYLNDASFYNYRLINRGSLTLDSCFTATWTDADLGYAFDDYIGSDTARGLGILYNAKAVDGNGSPNHYGNQVPMVGVDFFIGPKKFYRDSLGRDTFTLLKMANFTYFSQGTGTPPQITDPQNNIEFYRYMSGTNKLGQPFANDFKGRCGQNTKGYGEGPLSATVWTGDPSNRPSWSECCSENPPGDRRFVHSAGPFRLTGGGVTNDITIGACWVANVGGCPNTNFSRIKLADDAIQALFDNGFRLIQGPEAPRVVKRELDRRVILYLSNDSNSNNFQEKFGYDLSEQRYRVSTAKTRLFGGGDSLYRFEGYRLFQLRNANVTPSDIFGEDGRVNTALAAEVFQSDITNGIRQQVNHSPDNEVQGIPAFKSVIKVTGADQGIRHSIVVTQDAFAAGNDKQLVNYKTYYFVAIAYAYNNFRNFDPNNLEGTQDVTYLESAKGQGGTPIEVVAAMPNPSNTDMGTVLNSDYGSSVKITRIEGTGNGGNALQLTTASEDSAMMPSAYRVLHPEYIEGSGPVNVRVVDPVKLKEADWELSITGNNTYRSGTIDSLSQYGIRANTGTWKLTMNDGSTPVTIYGERNIDVTNEQILSQYGMSVEILQRSAPGDVNDSTNGYITSDVTFMDPAQAWLTGVSDGGVDGANFLNWIRSGSFAKGNEYNDVGNITIRDWVRANGVGESYDPAKLYEKLLANNTQTLGTWAPYMLTANRDSLNHAMMPSGVNGPEVLPLSTLPSIDVVFTSDKSKWSRCVVIETSSDVGLSEGAAPKFFLRRHRGWNKDDINASGNPIYNDTAGMSWFPGYAVNQETGERLNIFFGEDSYLTQDNGGDMIWNPTNNLFSAGAPVFGGKHFVWVTNTRYDSCRTIYNLLRSNNQLSINNAFRQPVWCGMPMSQAGKLASLSNGLIPTMTRLRFRVAKPYDRYVAAGIDTMQPNNGYPLYRFSTRGLGAKSLSDVANTTDKQSLLDRIAVVPNPYYAYSEHYEQNRLDTRVRVVNLPPRAEISIYSIDGSLVRRLNKDNGDVAYIDWDLRNAKGLPVASGMYLFHVKAEGIGETIVRFFGALRPLDIRNY